MTNRRTFLAQAALAAAGLMALPSLKGMARGNDPRLKGLAGPAPFEPFFDKKKAMVGLQLYSLREQLPKDVQGWIAKVAQAGYSDVETFGMTGESKFFGLDTKAFKALLTQNNLVTTSGHYGMDEYIGKGTDHDLGLAIDAVHTLGQRYLTVPYLNEQFRTSADDWKAVAGKFNSLAARLKSEGIRMAYHNHNFEFAAVGDTRGYDILLQNTDPSLVHFEMDLYWVVRGGADPVTLFHQHPGRFPMWHIKDMDKTTPTLNTEIGTGSIDFKAIMVNAKLAGLEQTFMEQENYAAGMDPFTSISQSAAYIKNNLLAR
jgi:sugar phosphate isomerase/epimerase